MKIIKLFKIILGYNISILNKLKNKNRTDNIKLEMSINIIKCKLNSTKYFIL